MGSKVSRIPTSKLAKLRDNAAQFKKKPELMSLILVRQREEQPQEKEQEEEEQTDFESHCESS